MYVINLLLKSRLTVIIFLWTRKTCKNLDNTYKQQSVAKTMGKTAIGQFCVSTPFPLLTMLKSNEKKLHQAVLWTRNIV